MSTAQSAPIQEAKGGMLFYPRKYVVDEANADLSYASGVDIMGKPMVVHIVPTDQARSNARNSDTAQSIPSFSEFSQTHRKAMHPCFASDDNSYATPAGVLLLEQVTVKMDLSPEHGCRVYNCKWASVLRETDDSPVVPIGYGYLEINCNKKYSDEVNEYINRYMQINADIQSGAIENLIDADQERMKLHATIMSKKKKWFIAVILKNKELIQLSDVSVNGFKQALAPILTKYTVNGMYGGALIRVRDGNVVLSEISTQCDMAYDYQNKRVKTVDEAIDEFLAWDGRRLISSVKKSPGLLIVEIIPTQRINCGKLGNDRYNKDLSYSGSSLQVPKTLKVYVSKDAHLDPLADYKKEKRFIYSMIAVRLAEIHKGEGAGNMLVSAIHAFSSPIGNPFAIDKTGKPTYVLNNDKWAKEKAEKSAVSAR